MSETAEEQTLQRLEDYLTAWLFENQIDDTNSGLFDV